MGLFPEHHPVPVEQEAKERDTQAANYLLRASYDQLTDSLTPTDPQVLANTGGYLRTVEELKSEVTTWCNYWINQLQLGGWEILLKFEDKLTYHEVDIDKEYPIVIRNITRWSFKSATIELDISRCLPRDHDLLGQDMLHELLHVLVNEMRWDTNRSPDKGHGCACEHDHEERVVTELTASIWALHSTIESYIN